MYRFDFIFSYWIFFWYLCYECSLTTYNPKLAIVLGLIENAGVFMIMLYYQYKYIAYFLIINFFIKVIPYWTVRNTPYTKKDVYALVLYFLIYLIWCSVNGKTLHDVAIRLQLIRENKPAFPLTEWIIQSWPSLARTLSR
jgi:hypothetical protein